MKVSPQGAAFIAAHEGVVTHAYRDVAGVWTIGVGHTAAAGPPRPAAGMTIARREALAILGRDLARFEARVGRAFADVADLSQPVFDGAVSFDFNTGAIDRASWVGRFKAGDRAGARTSLMRWVRAGGRRVAGLVRRREAEAALIFDGDYGAARSAPTADPEAKVWQRQLAALGFFDGPVDGIVGPKTHAATKAYQKSHPDLVVDGIAGPATRASLARDMAARRRAAQTGAAAVGAAASAGAATVEAGASHPFLWAMAIGLAVIVLAGGFFAIRYRGEFRRAVSGA